MGKMPLFSTLLPTIISILLQQALGGPVILGTSFLDQGNNMSDSVPVHYTRPVDGWVQLNDTYHVFSIVKGGTSCSEQGYLFVELCIGNMKLIKRSNLTGYNSWNINVTSACVTDGIHTAQLIITFDNVTFNGITEELIDTNTSSLSLRFVYRDYVNHVPVDISSPSAYIHVRHPSSHSDKVGSSLFNNSSTSKPGVSSTQADTSSPGIHCATNSLSMVSSSLNVQHVAKFHTFSLLIILLYHVVSLL